MSVSVTIKVKKEIARVAEEMVKLGIARSRNQAYNILLEIGLEKAKKLIEEEKTVNKLVKTFMEKGVPYNNLPTVKDVEEARNE